jgi:endonuclease YncB( thermonuclease family)
MEERLMMQLKMAIGLFSLFFCPLPLEASIILRVIDGDRVIASFQGKQTKIRLACIEAPEIGQAPHGRIARNTLIGLLPRHSRINVQPLNYDQNGWLVANILSLGGVDIGEELIRLGLVYVHNTSLSYCDGPKLLLIEDQARQSRIGIWKDTQQGLSRPWLYR